MLNERCTTQLKCIELQRIGTEIRVCYLRILKGLLFNQQIRNAIQIHTHGRFVRSMRTGSLRMCASSAITAISCLLRFALKSIFQRCECVHEMKHLDIFFLLCVSFRPLIRYSRLCRRLREQKIDSKLTDAHKHMHTVHWMFVRMSISDAKESVSKRD